MSSLFVVFIILFALSAVLFYITYKNIKNNAYLSGQRINQKWWVIGLSLFATDVSLSYIIGTTGIGFDKGLAVGSYSWTSSIMLIFVALYLLPKFMRLEIKTLPEYLELRFSKELRLIMAILFIVFLAVIALPSLYYSFSLLILNFFNIPPDYQLAIIIFIALFTGLFLVSLGMNKSMRIDVWIALITLIFGVYIFYLSVHQAGGFNNLSANAGGRLKSLLPGNDEFLPWTQVVFGGLWLMHLNYWTFFQPMTQKMVLADSLSEAQKGMMLTATLKVIIPFLFLIPGIVCFELYSDQIVNKDEAFPVLLKNIVPAGLQTIVILAFSATIISSGYAFLNAAALIFKQDIYVRFINKDSDEKLSEKIFIAAVFLFLMIAANIAPLIKHYNHVYELSQIIRSAVLPGIINVFLYGLLVPRANHKHAWFALGASLPVFFLLKLYFPGWIPVQLLGFGTLIISVLTGILVFFFPNSTPVYLLGKKEIRFERNLGVVIWSIFILTLVASIYVIFN